eukprot:Sdes_comp20358_c0_seq1m14149
MLCGQLLLGFPLYFSKSLLGLPKLNLVPLRSLHRWMGIFVLISFVGTLSLGFHSNWFFLNYGIVGRWLCSIFVLFSLPCVIFQLPILKKKLLKPDSQKPFVDSTASQTQMMLTESESNL